MILSRRAALTGAGATLLLASRAASAPADTAGLASLTTAAQPIGVEERRARLDRLQRLMRARKVAALLVEAGSTLDYFTGAQWWRSERTCAAVLAQRGDPILIASAFEAPSIAETLQLGTIRTWEEHESPFALIAAALKDRGAAAGPIAVEPTTRFFIVDGVRRALGGRAAIVPGEPLVQACRAIKSPHELALMQLANDVTLAALEHVRPRIQAGMSAHDIASLMNAATLALGGHAVEFSLVLLNEASAYPHGSRQPQTVREGSTILMDCGCNVFGYQSDISRTFFHGEPSPEQRRVWTTVRRGQEVALEAARPGVPVGRIDDAVRAYYEREGFGPGYRLPGLSHRTGHGIGLDGHESPYLVHAAETPLAPGMCFSDEPGIYLPGKFGVRLEDCWRMTEQGPKLFTPLAKGVGEV